jgi:fructuronate reductase
MAMQTNGGEAELHGNPREAQPMQRLTTDAVRQLPAGIGRPGYDRGRLAIGLAHIGVGAFHRCHQADYTDDMLSRHFGPWGIVGVNIRPPRLSESLEPQDCLYTRTLRNGSDSETRLIGCIRRVIDVDSAVAAEAAVAALAAPEVGTITLTLTEKGYCHTPATGTLDPAHVDIRHDHRMPSQPRTALELLARVFARRMALRSGPVTVVSCDNLPSNGRLLRRVLSDYLTDRPAPLQHWMRENVAFPCTMVDRIVPATAPEDLDWIAGRLGFEDRAAVVGEPFRQWVIEDSFAATRPPWAIAGAQLVAEPDPRRYLASVAKP